LTIVQSEEYLSAADTDIIKRKTNENSFLDDEIGSK
jgi:hypothetical protein